MSLNPFEIRAELLLQGCGLFHEISALHRVFRVIGVWGRGFFQRVTPQPENGFLADVQPLAEVQGGQEGGEVAAQGPSADGAAELHGLLLAR